MAQFFKMFAKKIHPAESLNPSYLPISWEALVTLGKMFDKH